MKLGQENKIMIKNFPTLYSKNNDGSIQQWNISVKDNIIIKKYGKINGKIQETKDEINAGKNIGKVNETSPEEQALSEAQSQWEKKLKSGYCQTEAEARQGKVDKEFITGGAEVMLAHRFKDHESKIIYPCYSQSKLDGHRCACVVNNGKCTLWSRTRKPITSVPHIIKVMEATFPNESIVLDGELYNHAYKNNFEEITSFIRSQNPKPGYEVVQYHVYDLIDDSLTFEERTEKIQKIKFAGSKVVKVETRKVNNVEELMDLFEKDLAGGWEGSMVRNAQSLYKHGRSYDLQKIKLFSDDEFEIIGVKNGKGRMVDCAIFICRTKTGNEFSCKMEGSLGNLKKYLINPEIVIGKQITVKFQNLTSDGLPRFPVGVRVEEDI
jgi:DNA ligase-1